VTGVTVFVTIARHWSARKDIREKRLALRISAVIASIREYVPIEIIVDDDDNAQLTVRRR